MRVMKRMLGTAVALAISAVVACASDNIRDAQAKLKENGFYFGQIDGAASTDFSAAVTRYQIRNGLQITGTLNAETSKALGVKAEATANQLVAPASETWRRLRTPDRKFLAHDQPPQRAASAKPAAGSNGSPTSVLESRGDGSTFVLNPERLRDYVAAFVLAGLDPQVGAELEFFGDPVRYYGDGLVGRDKIQADLRRYDARWPERHFWLAGNPSVTRQPDSRIRVSFPLRYQLRNGSKHSSGEIIKTILLEVHGEDLQIVAVNERKA